MNVVMQAIRRITVLHFEDESVHGTVQYSTVLKMPTQPA